MKTLYLSLALATTATLGACTTTTTVGENFDTSRVDELKIGQTTSAQTLAALGEPYSRNFAADGSEQWEYHMSQYKSSPKAKAFIPLVGLYTSNSTKQSQEHKTLALSFSNDVLASCKLTMRENEASGNIASAVQEAGQGGTSRELACGE